MKNYCITFSLLFISSLAFAQFPNIQWDYDVGAPSFGSSAAADLDKDGKLEIVFTTYTNDGQAHCINAEDGSVLWVYDIGGCGDVAPIIYDLDGDDTLDVFVNGSCNPTAFSINGITGALQWSIPSGGGDSPPTIADIDKDSLPEVLFGNFSSQVRIVNGEDGSTNKTININNGPIQTEPILVDVNNDSNLDIIVANWSNNTGYRIYCYDYNLNDTIWVHKDTSSSTFHAYHAGVLADVDNDSIMEYIIGRNNGSIRAINVEDGSELWTHTGLTNTIGALTCADVDRDDTLEIIYVNNDYISFNDHIGVLNAYNGQFEWSYLVGANNSSFRGAAISDINGNGQLDVITGHFGGKVRAVELYNGLLWELDLSLEFTPAPPFGFDVDHGPIIADFDHDDTLEVFVVAGHGTYTPDSTNVGRGFMIEAGLGYCPEWLMFRHDTRRTGYISTEEIDQMCDTTMLATPQLPVSASFSATIAPNPFVSNIDISFELPQEDWVQVELFNLQGQVIKTIQKQTYASGWHNMQVSLPTSLAAGFYWCRISTSQKQQTHKLIKY